MKILMAFPEESYTMLTRTKIPKRWTYYLEIGTYIRNQDHSVKFLDCLSSQVSHGEIYSEIAKNHYDLIILTARIESLRSIIKIVPILKNIDPNIHVLIYGDIANYAPNFIKSNVTSADAIVENGDWEIVICDYIRYLENKIELNKLTGVSINRNGIWTESIRRSEDHYTGWAFPDITTPDFINKNLYLNITNGELTLTASRGCPFECKFCPAVITFRKCDRRKKPCEIVDYMKKHKNMVKSFKLFSPTFTLDTQWVKELCMLMIKEDCIVPWTATTRPDCFEDDSIYELMGKSGCYKLAMGVETLDEESTQKLGKFTINEYENKIKFIFNKLVQNGIEPKPLMMLGLEGQTKEKIYDSIFKLKDFGAKGVRFASYSPRQEIQRRDKNNENTIEFIESLDKMTYQDINIDHMSSRDWLHIIYGESND